MPSLLQFHLFTLQLLSAENPLRFNDGAENVIK